MTVRHVLPGYQSLDGWFTRGEPEVALGDLVVRHPAVVEPLPLRRLEQGYQGWLLPVKWVSVSMSSGL